MSAKRVTNPITIRDAKIGFRNFAGARTEYNTEGFRNFAVFLQRDVAEMLEKDGWNIKWPKNDPDGDKNPFIKVSLSYDNYPPKIVLISSDGQTLLNGDTVKLLDSAEIKKVDLIIRPHNWEVGSKSGVKAWVKSMYVTIEEDELENEYRGVPKTDSFIEEDES